jgi:hypothetical protein
MMDDGRATTGEVWRHKAQDFFEDINSPELIRPEVPLFEKIEMWKLYMHDLKNMAKSGTEEEKGLMKHMFNLEHVGDEEDTESVFEDMETIHSGRMKSNFNMDDMTLEETVKNKVPKHAFYDLYNLFFTPNAEMKINSAPEELRWMEKLLFNSNNPYTKAVTENVPIYSYIASTEIIKGLLAKGYQFTEQSVGQAANKDIQGIVQKAMESAQGAMDQMGDTCETVGAGKVDADMGFKDMINISEYFRVLRDIPLKDELLKDFIKKTLKLSKSYFSSRYTEIEENIFEVDQLEDLEGLENLFPPLDLVNLGEIVTHERIYHNKVNLYIDRSGSMSSYWGYGGSENGFTDKNGNLEELGMAKLTALKLSAMGEVNEVRAFDNDVHEEVLDVRGMLFLHSNGGTNIDQVIDHVEEKKAPSIILTDMGDSIHTYSANVYFVGVGSARFSQFMHNDVGKQYIKNRQCVKYDSKNHSFTIVTGANYKDH